MKRGSRPARSDAYRSRSEGDAREFERFLSRRAILSALGVGTLGVAVGASGPALATRHTGNGDVSCLQPLEVLKLTASDAAPGDYLGERVSVSADGTTALVGGKAASLVTDPGAAYVYDLTQTPPTETKLTASDAAVGDFFGRSLSVSGDGTTALIGARRDDDAGDMSGSAYVYDLTQSPPTETKLTASDAAAGDVFGSSVSLSWDGNTALIGAVSDVNAVGESGSAYVYDLTRTPPTETKLTASDAAVGDRFGVSVSLSADGTTALVGAHYDDDGGDRSGSAYVYDLTQHPPTETKLTASDAAPAAVFGLSVSISADGTTALVGAYGALGGSELGSAYVYDLTQNPPTETRLTASDLAPVDHFGLSVSMDGDGSTALIGAYANDDAGNNSGSAYIYDLTQNPPTETKLTASDAAAEDEFGYSVSLSGDGSTALIGVPGDDEVTFYAGSAYVFELPLFTHPIELSNGTLVTPSDRDGDGLYEDLDCDGDVDGQDVSRLTRLENAYRRGQIELTAAQIAALDFNGDGQFTQADIDAYTAMYGL